VQLATGSAVGRIQQKKDELGRAGIGVFRVNEAGATRTRWNALGRSES